MPYPFRKLRKKLALQGIEWDRKGGKGSHGVFAGPDRHGRRQSFPLPRSQQREVTQDYMNALRRRFGLQGREWDAFFDD